ncbi:MAG: formylglycine-generating enzyme family protein [Bacteroidales bacterium]|nr:formylglycine-generating enzyme family protein [Bacteroidales bacterium]
MNKKIVCLIVSFFFVLGIQAQSLKEAAERQNNNVRTTSTAQKFTVEGVEFTMIFVKGGSFSMGATAEQVNGCDRDEKPVHSVSLNNYYIGECEVTQELWATIMGTTIEQQRDKANPLWPLRGEGDNYPMYYVSYDDIQEFILRLNEKTGKTFALPTEAQWEYAARGGNKKSGYTFSGDNDLSNVGWYKGNSEEKIHPVASKVANELGIYDMSGSVWEWCADWYSIDAYKAKGTVNPQGPAEGEDMVLRGGCIITEENSCRNANRGHLSPSLRNSFTGFRLVLIP